jgi:hypothetical protein
MAGLQSADRTKEQWAFPVAHPTILRLSPSLPAMVTQGPWEERAALTEKKQAMAIEQVRPKAMLQVRQLAHPAVP